MWDCMAAKPSSKPSQYESFHLCCRKWVGQQSSTKHGSVSAAVIGQAVRYEKASPFFTLIHGPTAFAYLSSSLSGQPSDGYRASQLVLVAIRREYLQSFRLN